MDDIEPKGVAMSGVAAPDGDRPPPTPPMTGSPNARRLFARDTAGLMTSGLSSPPLGPSSVVFNDDRDDPLKSDFKLAFPDGVTGGAARF